MPTRASGQSSKQVVEEAAKGKYPGKAPVVRGKGAKKSVTEKRPRGGKKDNTWLAWAGEKTNSPQEG